MAKSKKQPDNHAHTDYDQPRNSSPRSNTKPQDDQKSGIDIQDKTSAKDPEDQDGSPANTRPKGMDA